jgi:AraC-like DNA-binding protein
LKCDKVPYHPTQHLVVGYILLRFLNTGVRDFKADPVSITKRPNWEIYVVTDGQIAPVFPNKKQTPLKGKTVWIMPKDLQYGWIGNGNVHRYVFHFTSIPEPLRLLLEEHGHLSRELDDHEVLKIDHYYHSFKKHFHDLTFLSGLHIEKNLIDLSLMILEKLDPLQGYSRGKIDEIRIRKACDWYQEHMARSPSIEEVAKNVNLSAGYFRKIFFEYRKQKPHHYFFDLRMNKAKELLFDTSTSSLDIAERCGFSSASAFCRAFKQHCDMTPHQWQKTIAQF